MANSNGLQPRRQRASNASTSCGENCPFQSKTPIHVQQSAGSNPLRGKGDPPARLEAGRGFPEREVRRPCVTPGLVSQLLGPLSPSDRFGP